MKTPAGPAFAVDAVPFPPAADRPAAPPRRGWLRYPSSAYDQRSAMLFLAPMIAVLMTVAVFPVLYSFWISLFDLKLTRPHRVPFVWFDNYAKSSRTRCSGSRCCAPSTSPCCRCWRSW